MYRATTLTAVQGVANGDQTSDLLIQRLLLNPSAILLPYTHMAVVLHSVAIKTNNFERIPVTLSLIVEELRVGIHWAVRPKICHAWWPWGKVPDFRLISHS